MPSGIRAEQGQTEASPREGDRCGHQVLHLRRIVPGGPTSGGPVRYCRSLRPICLLFRVSQRSAGHALLAGVHCFLVADVRTHPRLNPDPEQPQACGDYNGKLAIYDLERNDVPAWSAKAHKSIINAVDGLGGPDSTYGAPELVSSFCIRPDKRTHGRKGEDRNSNALGERGYLVTCLAPFLFG